jgi:streptomycin 6-kinase
MRSGMRSVAVPGHSDIMLPQMLLENLGAVHGERRDAWLEALGPMLADILDERDARLVPGTPPLSYHLVVFARGSDGQDLVIKCTVPNAEQPSELAAVQVFSDAGIGPRLVWSNLDRGVMVMERVLPGTSLPTAIPTVPEDADVTKEIATLASRIARAVPIDERKADLVSVRDYSRALGEVDSTSSLWLQHRTDIERALTLRELLLDTPDRRDVVLHGDLHHYNVLRDARHGWRAIDPKGLVGPLGYEFGALTYNPVGIQDHPQLADIERQRVTIWSEGTGLPWETVRSWGYVAAVLSACWSGQGGSVHWQDAMRVAETLRDLTPFS